MRVSCPNARLVTFRMMQPHLVCRHRRVVSVRLLGWRTQLCGVEMDEGIDGPQPVTDEGAQSQLDTGEVSKDRVSEALVEPVQVHDKVEGGAFTETVETGFRAGVDAAHGVPVARHAVVVQRRQLMLGASVILDEHPHRLRHGTQRDVSLPGGRPAGRAAGGLRASATRAAWSCCFFRVVTT